MSIPALVKQIRQLPYADMMVLASELSEALKRELDVRAEASVLAAIISRLQSTSETEEHTTEHAILKEIFRRKRNLSVSLHGAAYHVSLSEQAGSQAIGPNLRETINNSLDQAITMHVLSRMK